MCSSKYNFWHETGYLFRPPLKWYIHRVRPAATWKIPPKTDQPDLDPLYTLARQGKRERALKLHAALNVNQSAVNPARESAVTEEIKLFFYLIWASAFVAPNNDFRQSGGETERNSALVVGVIVILVLARRQTAAGNWIIADRWGARLRARPSSRRALSRKIEKWSASSLARSFMRGPAWYGPPTRGILCDLVEGDRAVHPPGRRQREERGNRRESKTHVIATLIARINHNRGGKWHGELLKQGYVLSVALLRLSLGAASFPRFLALASTPGLFYLFSLSIPLASRAFPS